MGLGFRLVGVGFGALHSGCRVKGVDVGVKRV